MTELKSFKPGEIHWRILNSIYEGTYVGPEINGNFGNAVIKCSKLSWINGTSDGVIDSWLESYASPKRVFEFEFDSEKGYRCHGYYDELGYAFWTGRAMSAREICNIDKSTIKYC